jgi:hypothetical protein
MLEEYVVYGMAGFGLFVLGKWAWGYVSGWLATGDIEARFEVIETNILTLKSDLDMLSMHVINGADISVVEGTNLTAGKRGPYKKRKRPNNKNMN